MKFTNSIHISRPLNLLLLTAFLIIPFSANLFAEDSESLRMMILPISGDSRYSEEVTHGIYQKLGRISRFTLVDRNNLKTIIEEQKLYLSGLVSDSNAIRLGEIVGANKAISGNFTNTFQRINTDNGSYTTSEIQLNINIIDIETGKVDIALPELKATGSDEHHNRDKAFAQALDSVLGSFNRAIRSHYALQFSIYRREADTVIIKNDGNAGIQEGQYYQVIENVSFFDEETGEEFILDQSEKGIIKIDRVDEKYSYGSIIEGIHKIETGMLLEENPYYREKRITTALSYQTYENSEGYIPGFSLYSRSRLFNNLTTGAGLSMNFTQYITALDLYVTTGLEFPLVKEVLLLNLDGRLGLMFASQEGINIEQFAEDQNYNIKDSDPSALALELGAFVSLQLKLPQDLSLQVSGGYLFVPPIDEWELTEDKDKDPERWEVPAIHLEQPTFDPSGIYLSVGLGYSL